MILDFVTLLFMASSLDDALKNRETQRHLTLVVTEYGRKQILHRIIVHSK